MIICNITWNVSAEALEPWKNWLRHNWMPVLQQRDVRQLHFCRLLHQPDEGFTFTQQMGVQNIEAYQELMQRLQPELQEMTQLLGSSVVYFQTVMEEISL
ncbi:uncharacterized protein DUF4286 [Thermoflavifilum aggregans]|uniref:Uncharacterized protein DUF4286 n=1 Tax=Thermoflavifilum aggregans TaxID=454188 RepID=A0A2M9CS41_9BACT|nr:DUF4286 family protein [Thermoflavifilum aggregans]PJJ74752.1 uncharacterized protein DUF4286 [Thermoflavifilum aggregans]